MIKVCFLPAAEIELLKEVTYYSKAHTGVGFRFQAAVEAAVVRAAHHPLGGPLDFGAKSDGWPLPGVSKNEIDAILNE